MIDNRESGIESQAHSKFKIQNSKLTELDSKLTNSLNSFSNYLFWDTDITDLDPERNAYYIIPRVVDYGMQKDVKLLFMIYAEDFIKNVLLSVPYLHKQTISYFALKYNLTSDSFRSFRKRLENQNWK
ncbi:MAG: hypothetical protein K9M99_05260 [Candidatus Cloacimonetes bacterium]|nr:hypothetical protein [Candidatus Cloacimonadota bacterium]